MTSCSIDPEYPDYEKFQDNEEKICKEYGTHYKKKLKEEIEDGRE